MSSKPNPRNHVCAKITSKKPSYIHFNSTSPESRRSHLLCISQHHHLFYHKEVLRGDHEERARPSDKKRKVIAVVRKQYFHIKPKLQLFACHIIVLRTHWIYFFIFYFSGFRPTRLFLQRWLSNPKIWLNANVWYCFRLATATAIRHIRFRQKRVIYAYGHGEEEGSRSLSSNCFLQEHVMFSLAPVCLLVSGCVFRWR